jgi:hypothetical protein
MPSRSSALAAAWHCESRWRSQFDCNTDFVVKVVQLAVGRKKGHAKKRGREKLTKQVDFQNKERTCEGRCEEPPSWSAYATSSMPRAVDQLLGAAGGSSPAPE